MSFLGHELHQNQHYNLSKGTKMDEKGGLPDFSVFSSLTQYFQLHEGFSACSQHLCE